MSMRMPASRSGGRRLALAAVALTFAAAAGVPAQQAPASLTLRVENPAAVARVAETVAVPWEVVARLPGAGPGRVRVREPVSGRELTAQALDGDADGQLDSLLFQASFEPRAAKLFLVEAAAPADSVVSQAHVLFVPEREDVAWESDRIAFRIYGKKLWELENLHTNGIDVWPKRTRRLVLDEWYSAGHDSYHIDKGEGADFFQVGPTLGAGGTGIWRNGVLHRGDNFLQHRLIADGPVRAIFELDYGAIDAAGLQAMEHKRVSIDAGQHLFRQESTFRASEVGELEVVVGLVKRADMVGSTSKAAAWAWLSGWGPIAPGTGGHGELGTAVLVPRAGLVDSKELDDHYITISRVPAGQPLVSYVGAGWSSSRDFGSAEEWWRYLANFAQRLEHPLKVQVLPPQTSGRAGQ